MEESNMEKIENMFAEIANKLTGMDDKFERLINENTAMKEQNRLMKEKILHQDRKIDSLEREIRRKNIIIKGVEDIINERAEDTRDKVTKLMQDIGVEMDEKNDIDEIRRIGKFKNQYKRPIIIKLTSGMKKTQILHSSKNLKGSNIWIDEDYSREILEERKMLIPHMKEAKQKGYKTQMKYNKLIINGEMYGIEELSSSHITEGGERMNFAKRTVSERSPTGDSYMEQSRKVTRTSTPKN
uniref:Uncharacterized protein n=1 Tax=Photinus pyralis TaxID=7054 RepID=A0A1Y1K306_PHOPY